MKTILFVTHDVFEAVKMGDRIALLNEGRLQQLAPPAELVETPANEFVDQFLGQHRFQLSLLTTTLGSIVAQLDATSKAPDGPERLTARNSLIDALDRFKKTKRRELPVYERGRFRGNLRKTSLLSLIAKSMGEAGEP